MANVINFILTPVVNDPYSFNVCLKTDGLFHYEWKNINEVQALPLESKWLKVMQRNKNIMFSACKKKLGEPDQMVKNRAVWFAKEKADADFETSVEPVGEVISVSIPTEEDRKEYDRLNPGWRDSKLLKDKVLR